jgi:hypothetical protein
MSSRFLEPPTPPSTDDQQRVEEAGRRRSVLEGTWETLLRAHLVQQLGRKRSRMVGLPDISSNLLKQVVVQVARLYSKSPTLSNPDRAGLEVMGRSSWKRRRYGASLSATSGSLWPSTSR